MLTPPPEGYDREGFFDAWRSRSPHASHTQDDNAPAEMPRLHGGCAHDLRSSDLHAAPRDRGRIRGALCQTAAPTGETFETRGLLAHRVRSTQPGHPRLSLRRPAAAHGGTRRAGERYRSGADPQWEGVCRRAGGRDHDPGAVYA